MHKLKAAFLSGALIAALTATAPVSAGGASARFIETGLIQSAEPVDVLARFRDGVPLIAGVTVHYRFSSMPAIYATATPAGLRGLAAARGLVALERSHEIEFDLDTATTASRAREVWGGPDPVYTGDGALVDGSGIGIAIVDDGLDADHPDFAGKVRGNFLMTPGGPVASPFTHTSGNAHGTHVAGIAAGSGAASDGSFKGVAPGASLYGFQMHVGSTALAAIAFDWILEHGDEQSPPIRIVNNSWHCNRAACQHPFNPDRLHYTLASELATNGIVVTWSAGNIEGDGDIPTTNPEATNPTPGIIGVANYKDEDTGRRDLCLSSASSWGSSYDPSTWPDISAPGRSIMSTWGVTARQSGGSYSGRNPVNGSNSYRILTGTSMAAPHVAGIAAMLLQAYPSLTPGDVEYLVKQTATELIGPAHEEGCGLDYVRADATHPWHGSNYAAGHGLVDARAAIDLARTFAGKPAPVETEPLPDDFVTMRRGFETEHTFYLTGESGFTTTYPDAPTPRVRLYDMHKQAVHTSAPLEEAITFDSLRADVYVGNSSEHGEIYSYVGRSYVQGDIERVAPDGSSELLASRTSFLASSNTMSPLHRDLLTFLDREETLNPGDRIRLTISYAAEPFRGLPVNETWDLYTEGFTPSRVEFGHSVAKPVPGTRAHCERRQDCAMVDGLHPWEGVLCNEVDYRLWWEGPIGSSLILECNNTVYTCAIADAPQGGNGRCETQVDATDPVGSADLGAICTYRMPDGARGGRGGCEALSIERD